MGADNVRSRLQHLFGLRGIKDKSNSQQTAVMRQTYRLDLLFIAHAILLKRTPKNTVNHTNRRIVHNPGKADIPNLFDVVIHLLGRIRRVEAEENRYLFPIAQQLALSEIHHEVIAVAITHKARHGSAAH